MPLINQSGASIFWRAFDPTDTQRTMERIGFAGTLPSGHSVAIAYPLGQFQLEIRDRPPISLVPSRLLVAAGPAGGIGPRFRPSDDIVFDAAGLRVVSATAAVDVPGFLPSTSGFRFRNSFPPNSPHQALAVAGRTIALGDAANGLCGGMVFAARDYHEARLPIPANHRAPVTGPLFDHLVQRLWASFNGPTGVARYLSLMHPDTPGQERARVAFTEAWPRIKAEIDAGLPSPIGLVQVRSADAMQLGLNHQVLAYGYRVNGTSVVLRIYDPNHPREDDVTLSFNINDPVPACNYSRPVGGDGMIRGFFRHEYTFVHPPQNVPGSQDFAPVQPLAPGVTSLFEGNGSLGLMRVHSVSGTSFSGTVYGQPIEGQWNTATRTVSFTRRIEPGYEQTFTGRIDAERGRLAGSFQERRNGQLLPERYSWRAVSRLAVEGNGWPAQLELTELDASGRLAGRLYGDAIEGQWDHGSRWIRFRRQGGDPNYAQNWSGRCSFGLDFDGTFKEVLGGVEQNQAYRWLARDRPLGNSRIQVRNALGRSVRLRIFDPAAPDHIVALPGSEVDLANGQTFTYLLPGVPLLITSGVVRADTGATVRLGYGDCAVLEADGRFTPE